MISSSFSFDADIPLAPMRSFWTENTSNPMYLFFGARARKDLPFAYEIEQLKNAGLLTPFLAYSNEPGMDKKYVQDIIQDEADTVLNLLHDSKTRIYVCGRPEMEWEVREVLTLLLANGNRSYPALGVTRAIERLSLLKTMKKYITEVYGTTKKNKNTLEKATRAQASHRKVKIPLAPYYERDHYRGSTDEESSNDQPSLVLDRMTATHRDWKKSVSSQSHASVALYPDWEVAIGDNKNNDYDTVTHVNHLQERH